MNIPHTSASSVTMRYARRQTASSEPSVSRRPTTRLGHAAQSLQVNSLHTAGISDGQSKLHHDEAVPMLDGASFRLPLPLCGREVVRELARPEVDGLRLADADGQKNDAGYVVVAVRMYGKVFLIGHGSTVHGPISIARDI